MLEANLRRGLMQTGDDVIAFVSGPIIILFLGLSLLSLVWPLLSKARLVPVTANSLD